MEEYIWNETTLSPKKEYLTLVIYDVSDNKLRLKMVKLLKRYGMRIQKSAFEAYLNGSKFEKMKKEIAFLVGQNDGVCVKIYRLKGVSETYSYGEQIEYTPFEDVIFI